MKKTFILMSLLLGLVVNMMCLTACGDDDDDSNPLIGTWYVNDDDGDYEEITFFDDGKCVHYSESKKWGKETLAGTYTADATKVLLMWSNGDTVTWKYSISGNKMTTQKSGGTRTWVWTKK